MADAFPTCGVLGANALRAKESSALDGVISENSVHIHAVVCLGRGSQDIGSCLSGMPAHNQTDVGPQRSDRQSVVNIHL